MEEDKKKKKNKKKKNKQNAVKIDDTSVDGLVGGDSIPSGENHATGKTQVDLITTMDLHQDAQINLPKENMQAVTRAGLLEKLEELQKEKAAHIQEEASLQEQISQLKKEIDAYMKKEAGLEKKIAELQMEKEFQVQKENLLEEKIGQLQRDKESWFQKEVLFEEKINHLMDEAATLSLEKVSLEEKVKQMEREQDSWILPENLTKEVIASLDGDNSSLKSQVVELEELRNSVLQENHFLKETISDLQSQILNLERTAVSSSSSTEIKIHPTENGDAAPRTEAADALVEKLIGENAAFVEKVNELYIELHNKNLQPETSFTGNLAGVEGSFQSADDFVRLQSKVGATEMHETAPAHDVIAEASENMKGSDLRVQTLKSDANSDMESNEYLDANNTVLFPDSSKIIESDEIVQIPLDENEREPTDMEASNDVEDAKVLLIDAPLIGAPFRLISFVARYVSGADLVEKNSAKSGG